MIVKDPGGGSNFEPAPAGSHVARCVFLIDIGTQQSEFQGETKLRRQAVVGWELPNELVEEGDKAGKPFTISKFYTLSLHEKANLRKDLVAWRGRDFTPTELEGFDLKTILGAPCMLSVIHNDNGKAQVSAVMALPKGTSCPDRVNTLLYFSLDEYEQEVFDGLSDGWKKMVQASPEYTQATGGMPPGGAATDCENTFGDDDDIPF